MRTFIEIDSNALKENYLRIKENCSKNIIAVIKSNAYGHGLIECARILYHLKVSAFAVATIEEAIAIRKSLIFTPILLLCPCYDYRILSSYKITSLIVSLHHLEKMKESPYPLQIHLCFDTGMNRDGLNENELDNALDMLKKSSLYLKGICTHYCSKESYPYQREIFERILLKIPHKEKLCIHSSATSTYKENTSSDTHIRIGLALYGLDGDGIPVLSLKAPIIRKKKVLKGDIVGYDEKGIVPDDGYLYTIPLGYADGWTRNYLTKGYINDHELIQIGLTCMDYLMLFSKDNFSDNEIITIIGNQHTVQDIAHEQNTIAYEITTKLNQRLKRICQKIT